MADFQKHKPELDELDVRIIALSSDAREDALGTVNKLGLDFPVIYGLDAKAASRLIGCFTGLHEGTPHVQPASFVLDAEGKIVHAVYSSGKVGRLTAEDALTLARATRRRSGRGQPDADHGGMSR